MFRAGIGRKLCFDLGDFRPADIGAVIEDAQAADNVFDLLMGTEVAPRKSFIQSNAKYANLDI